MKLSHLWGKMITGIALALCFFPANANTSATVVSSTVKKQVISDMTIAYGAINVISKNLRYISIPYSGEIRNIWVYHGQKVKQGQKLIELTIAPEDKMKYVQAQNAVALAKKQLIRNKKLLKSQLVTQNDVDTAESNLNNAKAALTVLKQKNFDKTTRIISAPVEGIITQLNVFTGQRITANTNIAVIAKNQLSAQIGLTATQAQKLNVGLPVKIISIFNQAIQVNSSINDISYAIDKKTELINLQVDIPPQKSHLFLIGEKIKAIISTDTHVGLVVPRSAVLSSQGKTYVFKNVNNKAVKIWVKTGIEQENSTEIIGSLKAGDKVISKGNYVLKEGMALREIQK